MKKTLILLSMITCLSSCVKDEGNYTYTEVNKVTIEGLEESYNVIKDVDEAVRVRIYKDGKYVTYAKLGANGKAETNTIPFKDDETVVCMKKEF